MHSPSVDEKIHTGDYLGVSGGIVRGFVPRTMKQEGCAWVYPGKTSRRCSHPVVGFIGDFHTGRPYCECHLWEIEKLKVKLPNDREARRQLKARLAWITEKMVALCQQYERQREVQDVRNGIAAEQFAIQFERRAG